MGYKCEVAGFQLDHLALQTHDLLNLLLDLLPLNLKPPYLSERQQVPVTIYWSLVLTPIKD